MTGLRQRSDATPKKNLADYSEIEPVISRTKTYILTTWSVFAQFLNTFIKPFFLNMYNNKIKLFLRILIFFSM